MHGRCVNYRIRRIKDKDNTISFSLVLVNNIYVRVANINICLPCICFLVCSKVFEALWKSGPAKTGPAGPVPPPLKCSKNTVSNNGLTQWVCKELVTR